MADELTGRQWTALLSLLSLDSILPLYGEMGVPSDEAQVLQAKLRETILQVRLVVDHDPTSVATVQNTLIQMLDPATVARFLHWANEVFLGDHSEQPSWSGWDIVFSHWAYSRQEYLGFLPQVKSGAFVTGYRKMVGSEDVKEKASNLSKRPLSDWDKEMYIRHGYGAAWEDSPYSTAEWITRVERLKQFALHVWSDMEPQEREEFQRHAQMLLDDLHVWMPGPLPSLTDLLDLK